MCVQGHDPLNFSFLSSFFLSFYFFYFNFILLGGSFMALLSEVLNLFFYMKSVAYHG